MFLSEEWVHVYARIFYLSGIFQIIPFHRSPLILTSGIESRIFIDARMISQFPEFRDEFVLHHFSQLIDENFKTRSIVELFDLVCSIPHGADHLAALVGEKRKLPVFQFEKKGEEYGLSPGSLENLRKFRGKKALLVDDVLTTGTSSGKEADFLKEQGVEPVGLVCLVDRQRGGAEYLLAKKIKDVHCLMTMESVLRALLHRTKEFGKKLPPIIKSEEEEVIREELSLIQKGGIR